MYKGRQGAQINYRAKKVISIMKAKTKEIFLSDRVEGLIICIGVICALSYGVIDMVPTINFLFDVEDTEKFLFDSIVLIFSTIMISVFLGIMLWNGCKKLFHTKNGNKGASNGN